MVPLVGAFEGERSLHPEGARMACHKTLIMHGMSAHMRTGASLGPSQLLLGYSRYNSGVIVQRTRFGQHLSALLKT